MRYEVTEGDPDQRGGQPAELPGRDQFAQRARIRRQAHPAGPGQSMRRSA